MARYVCARCAVVTHDNDGPHLCKDLRLRYERQQKAIALIVGALRECNISPTAVLGYDDIALKILTALSGRDLGFG